MHLKTLFGFVFLISVFLFSDINEACALNEISAEEMVMDNPEHSESNELQVHEELSEHGEDAHHSALEPAGWAVIPFVLLLSLIAIGPLLFEHFWHKNYPKVAVALAAIVLAYYLLFLGNTHEPVHAFFEYFQFISLLSALFIASGGILINIDKEGKPLTNVILLLIGAVIANLIGTTGASMLLIRPYIRLNRNRVKPYHIVFFIFIVSNIGGSLTPIGDPPLFLGFLKGVPFQWTVIHNILPWAFGIGLLLILFYLYDRRNTSNYFPDEEISYTGKLSIRGKKNFIWLAIIIIAVFLDPNLPGFEWVPGVEINGATFSFVRETIMLSCAFFSYKFGNTELLKENDFDFEPIREVAFIFIGIFATMMPALQMVGEFAQSPAGAKLITSNTLYWGTGFLSGFLDNAPTYLNFLAAAMASKGASISDFDAVVEFARNGFTDSTLQLKAISIAAVFFGALTYIGNGPNFMVKSISEQIGIKMPSFFGYILRFSIPILIPLLLLVWLIFFAFA
ncbi:sodium:proton antiporter [Hyphobacterium sp. CCMP332]|nr:sodium:proton antiporter [Hyphobacterium sp. CCMP332]